VIYIAGPLTNADPIIQAANIDRAQRAFYALLEVGLMGICPHFSGTDLRAFDVAYNLWIKNGLAQLNACDGIWLLPGWHRSNGALLELAQVRKNRSEKRQEVFYRLDRLARFYNRDAHNRWWNDDAEYTQQLPA
jgi:hypothetical protein